MDAEVLAGVLSALASAGGEPGQRAWTALAGMTVRTCGRYSAEGRAVETACDARGHDRANLGGLARLVARRADSDARFAAVFIPWLAAVQMLLPGLPGAWPMSGGPVSDSRAQGQAASGNGAAKLVAEVTDPA